MKKIFFLFLMCSCGFILNAQDSVNQSPSPDGLRANEKIYVVMAIVITILCGLLFYLTRLDRKITKLEKQQKGIVD